MDLTLAMTISTLNVGTVSTLSVGPYSNLTEGMWIGIRSWSRRSRIAIRPESEPEMPVQFIRSLNTGSPSWFTSSHPLSGETVQNIPGSAPVIPAFLSMCPAVPSNSRRSSHWLMLHKQSLLNAYWDVNVSMFDKPRDRSWQLCRNVFRCK